jgi:AcrR family transcriptional regulator
MARPRKAAQRNTKQAILDAALDLFAERGYFGTSMRQIARAVGVRESALYHHFESKQAVFRQILTTLGPGRVSLVVGLDVEGLAKALGARALLKRLLDTLLVAWTAPEEQKVFRVFLQEGFRLATAEVVNPLAALERVRAALTRAFEQLAALGLIRQVDPAATALTLMGSLMALRMLHLAHQPDLEAMQGELDALHAHFWDTIKPLAPRASRRKAS